MCCLKSIWRLRLPVDWPIGWRGCRHLMPSATASRPYLSAASRPMMPVSAFSTAQRLWHLRLFYGDLGINFALHFHVWHDRKLSHYWSDPEARMYIYLLLVGILITCLYLYYSGTYGWSESIRQGGFHLISIMTTTGFTSDNFQWLAHLFTVLPDLFIVLWCLCRLDWRRD